MKRSLAFSTFGMRLLAAMAGFLTVVLCSQFLGAAGRGQLSLLLAWIQLWMIANEFVGGSTLVNLTPRYGIGKLWPGSLLWLLALVMVAFFWHPGLALPQFLWPALAFMALLGILTIHYSLLQGSGQMLIRNRAQLMLEAGKVLLLAGLILWAQGNLLEVTSVVWAFAAAALVAVVYTLPAILRQWKEPGLPPGEMFRAGWWSQLGHLVQFLNYRSVLFLISEQLGDADAGKYSNALVIADAVWIFGNSLGSVAHMKMVLDGRMEKARGWLRRYTALSFWGTVPAVLALSLQPDAVFIRLFGSDFDGFGAVLRPLLPAILALSWSTVPSHFLHARGAFRSLLLLNACGWVLQISLAWFMVPAYGLAGAAWAASAGFAGILIVQLLLLRKRFGLSWRDVVPSGHYAWAVVRKIMKR